MTNARSNFRSIMEGKTARETIRFSADVVSSFMVLFYSISLPSTIYENPVDPR